MSARKKAKATSAAKSCDASCVGCDYAFLDNEKKRTFCTHPETVAEHNGMTAMEDPTKRPIWCKLEAKPKEE